MNIAEQSDDQIVTTNMDMDLPAIFQSAHIWSSMEFYKLSCVKYQTLINYGSFQ